MIARLLGLRMYEIEPSGLCNLNCVPCPRHRLPPGGMMSAETFCRFLRHTPLGATDCLTFAGLGEPTLNPLLPDFIREARKRYPKLLRWDQRKLLAVENAKGLSPEKVTIAESLKKAGYATAMLGK